MSERAPNQGDMRISLWATTVTLRVSSVAVMVANFAIIARLLGPDGSGRYFVFLSVVLLTSAVAELGLAQSAIIFPARNPADFRQIHRIMLRYAMVLSSVAAAIAIGVFAVAGDRLLPGFPTTWMIIACVAVPPALYANLWNGMAVGMARLITAGRVQLVVGVFTLLVNAVVLGVFVRSDTAAVWIYVLGLLVQAAVMVHLAPALAPPGESPGRPGLAREMLGFGLRGYAGGMSTFLWMRLTVFLLNAYHGPAAVGLFSVAQQVAEKALLPVQVMREVLYRGITAANPAQAVLETNRFARVVLAVLAPCVLIAGTFAPLIVAALFGAGYQDSVTILRVLLAGTVVMTIPTLLAPYFLGQLGRPGLLSMLAWVNGGLNGGLALWLIPTFSGTGAAAALLASQSIGTGILLALYLRYASTRMKSVVVIQAADVGALWRQVETLIRPRRR